jgi:hypothetical protein
VLGFLDGAHRRDQVGVLDGIGERRSTGIGP